MPETANQGQEIAVVEKPVVDLAKLNISETAIAEMKEEYKGLVIHDPQSFEVVRRARQRVRETRTGLDKARIDLKRPLLDAGKLIDETAKKYTDSLLEIETPLDKTIKDWENQKEIEKEEKAKKAQQELTDARANLQTFINGVKSSISNIATIEEVDTYVAGLKFPESEIIKSEIAMSLLAVRESATARKTAIELQELRADKDRRDREDKERKDREEKEKQDREAKEKEATEKRNKLLADKNSQIADLQSSVKFAEKQSDIDSIMGRIESVGQMNFGEFQDQFILELDSVRALAGSRLQTIVAEKEAKEQREKADKEKADREKMVQQQKEEKEKKELEILNARKAKLVGIQMIEDQKGTFVFENALGGKIQTTFTEIKVATDEEFDRLSATLTDAIKKSIDEVEKRRAALLPEREKLTKWLSTCIFDDLADVSTPEAMQLSQEILARFNGFKTWANERIDQVCQ